MIVVQDSTAEPMPVHLAFIERLHKRAARPYLCVFTNTSKIDDQELLEIETVEFRELFNGQGLPGDKIQFAFASVTAPVASTSSCPKGWDAIEKYVRALVK